MEAFVYALGFCVVALLVYMARYSGRLRVAQMRTIDAPLAAVYARVSDFGQWREWCPWLEHETDPQVAISPASDRQGSRYAWTGARIGEGTIEHTRLQPMTRIDQRMRFRTPFRFHGRGCWQFAQRQGKTELTWTFRGRVGFAMRAFAPTVQGMVALDFRYGLDRLAWVLEGAAAARYSLTYLGERDVAAARYAYVTHSGPLDGLGAAIRNDLATLRQRLAGLGLQAAGAPIAAYIRTHIKRRTTVCQIGVPIGDSAQNDLPVRELPAHRAYVVRVDGRPAELEVAWYQAMQRMRIEGVLPDPRLSPYERYVHGAEMASANDQVTELCIPVRQATRAVAPRPLPHGASGA